MEKSRQVKVYEVRLYCDECGEEMKEVEPNVVLTTFPPQYRYYCLNPKCSLNGKMPYNILTFCRFAAIKIVCFWFWV